MEAPPAAAAPKAMKKAPAAPPPGPSAHVDNLQELRAGIAANIIERPAAPANADAGEDIEEAHRNKGKGKGKGEDIEEDFCGGPPPTPQEAASSSSI